MIQHTTARPDNSDFSHGVDIPRVGLLRELWDFLAQNKKWWLAPIILALLMVGVLIALGSTAAAPFIYTIF